MLVNYFDINNDEITILIGNDNDTKQIINKLMEKYLQDKNMKNTFFDIVDYYVTDKNRMKRKHTKINHHITKITCEELDDYLIK